MFFIVDVSKREKKKERGKEKIVIKKKTPHLLPALIWLMPHFSSSLLISGDSRVDRIMPV